MPDLRIPAAEYQRRRREGTLDAIGLPVGATFGKTDATTAPRPQFDAPPDDYPDEAGLQRAVCERLATLRPACVWFHVPNGGKRGRLEAAIFHGLGVRAGAADLIFLWRGGCGCIELKQARGPLSRAQHEFKEKCERLDVPYAVARSVAEVEARLLEWGLLEDGR